MVQVENKKGNLLGYIMLFTLDVTSVVLFACILTIATPTPALAYVDPSVMTYTIQIYSQGISHGRETGY